MDSVFPHLKESTRELLDRTDKERIDAILMGEWIPYTRAKEILAHLEELFEHPRIDRMPNMLLVGASNNGKTQILKRFEGRHPADQNPNGDYSIVPVLRVESPSGPDIGDLYDRIFAELNHPYSPRAPVKEKLPELMNVLAKVQLKVLLFDEIQHLLSGGPVKQQEFRNAIKSLGNMLRVSIVCAGVEEALNAFTTDSQLSNRFEPEYLPKWKWGDEFGILLNSMERMLPLRYPSQLNEGVMANRIYSMSEGILGEVHEILKRAAKLAINNKTERITLETLDSIRWTLPSKRRGHAYVE